MRRRRLFGLCASATGLALLSGACTVPPIGQRRLPRIGYITVGPRESRADRIDAFLQGLRELGYVEDRTVNMEWRFWSDGGEAGLANLADELVRLPVDVLVTEGSTQVSQVA